MPPPPPSTLPPDESRGHILNIVGWVGAAIATLFVALRVYSRKWITHSAGWDDAIIVFAAILNLATVTLGSVAVSYGNGRHIYYLSNEDVLNALYYSVIVQPIGIAAYCLPKLSVVILIVSLVGTQERKRSIWFLYSVIAILFITSALASILLFAQCTPPNHLWHPFSVAECWPAYVEDNVTYVGGSWSAFTDLVLAVFPITLLWNLQMKRSRKISIMIVMGLGAFAMIAAIVKTTQLSANHSKDPTWDLFSLFITTYVETDLVIMAACTPPMRPLVLKLLGKDSDISGDRNQRLKKSSLRGYRSFDNQSHSMCLNDMNSRPT